MDRRDFLKAGSALSLGSLVLTHETLAQSPGLRLPLAGADGWVSLINGRDLSGWYTMLIKSGKGVAEAKKMVAMEQEMLHVMGNQVTDEKYESGYLATNQEFENVRIRVEYKWGVKQFDPRSISKRDNGVLYGLVGEDKVWPACVECQVEEGDVGDFFLLGGVRGVQTPHKGGLSGIGVNPATGWPKPGSAPNNPARPQALPEDVSDNRRVKDGNLEKLDDWNVIEIIWQGDKAVHIINGRAVNAITGLEQPDPHNPGKFLPLTRGKIAIELEFAEIWYRRIEVKSLL